ncbi:hypothetical protein [uncultured Rikenella sp.]|uniref:hypothetical protein n=1 Tax=uncultured Rikenella sp. TaxID=368003 RepID=UPI00262CA088|nr:hypothetical protein [uncultured Rikenella sp.]
MTPATHTELLNLAKMAADYITKLNGESETFDVYTEHYTATIDYRATIGEDAGDRWTASDWWIESEETRVEGVYNEEGEEIPELTEWMKKMLN